MWRKLTFTGNSRGFGGRELWSFCPASTVDRCASGRARSLYALTLYADPSATLDDLRKAVMTLEDADRTARRVFGGSNPVTTSVEHALRNARATLRARETPSPPV